ncbi:MAG: hypothetical protein KDJ47_07750 [Hyphomicrobiaceae bacterium]|nr:hypothetical protein [Hyphomicrobiaceae bacterium]
MANDFDIRHFFRRAPRDWLQRYFAERKLILDFDWASLGKHNIDPLLRRWQEIAQDQRIRAVEEFRKIRLLATPACKVQIIDEAAFHGLDDEVGAKLAELGDFYACAFWVLLEQPNLWEGALRFADADGKSGRYLRKRINMPKLGRAITDNDADMLAKALSALFVTSEGRGTRCVVHAYRRGADARREYFFAYPEDHKHTPLVFEEEGLVAKPHNPAFEVIFIHDDDAQTLTIWHEGNKKRIQELQTAFAQAVLGRKIPRNSPKDDRAYDLQMFLDPDFAFSPDPVLGMERVNIRKLRVHASGQHGLTVRVDLDQETPSHALHETVKRAFSGVRESQLEVTFVGLQVIFYLLPGEEKKRTRSFQIATPNSCNLKPDQLSPLIEKLLVDHGIEPRRPRENGDAGLR